MRPLSPSLPLLLLAVASCSPANSSPSSSPNLEILFPVAETAVESEQDSPPLHGIATQFGGEVPVFVGPSKVPQTLSLMSESSAIWHVYLLPGANVSKIYVAGFEQQRVIVIHSRHEAVSTDPKIVNLSGEAVGDTALSLGPPLTTSSKKFHGYRDELKRETGLDLTGFAGNELVCLNCAFAVALPQYPSDQELNDHFPAAVRRERWSDTAEFDQVRRDLMRLIRRRAIPAQMPLFENVSRQPSQVRHWPLLPVASPTPFGSSECGRIALGTPSDDGLWCGDHDGYVAATSWILGGNGNDILGEGMELSQVFSGGRGDDIINADLGNDVLYFGSDWGDDIVDMRCLTSPDDRPLPRYQDSRYVVFGSGVFPRDLAWVNEREIEDRVTGSRLRFTGELCPAKFIAVESGRVPPRPMPQKMEWPTIAHQ